MQPSSPKQAAGMTAVELLLAIAIASILGLFTASSIASIVHKARGNVAGARLVDLLTEARSLAVTRETDVVLCPSSDGSRCSSGDHWETGWIAFADRNEDNERGDDEAVLLQQGPLGAKVHLVSTLGRTRLRFKARGSNFGSNVTFTLCDGRGPPSAVSWILSNTGNLRSAPATAAAANLACYGG